MALSLVNMIISCSCLIKKSTNLEPIKPVPVDPEPEPVELLGICTVTNDPGGPREYSFDL